MTINRSSRFAARRRTAALSASVLVAALALPLIVTAPAAQASTDLLSESFTNNTVTDPNFTVLGNTNGLPCLTASTITPGGSSINDCAAGQTDVASGGDGQGTGALRLTDIGLNEAGALLYNKALPLSQGADISFDFAMYGGTVSNNGAFADGISLFLADGANALTATGASGGSLGYAQKTSASTGVPAPGLTNGFLGLGLDEYGNYELDAEGRGSTGGSATSPGTVTCPQTAGQQALGGARSANQVGLRGPGNGYNNYCLLDSTNLNDTTQSLHGTGTNHLQAGTLETARITIDPSSVANPKVTVYLAFNQTPGDTVAPTQVFQTAEPANAPSTFRFGLASSTGAKNDIHEILNLKVKTLNTEPAYSIGQTDTSNQLFDAGATGTFNITPTLNSGSAEQVAPVVTENLPTGLSLASVPTPTGYTCTGPSGGQTLTCTYTGSLPIAVGTVLPTIAVPVNVAGTATGQLTATASITSGDASNTATGTDTVTVVAAPLAVTESATTTAGTNGGAPVALSVLTNDTGTGITVKSATQGSNGSTTVSTDGKTITYTPAAGFSGKDSFIYTITDPRGVTSSVQDNVLVKPVGADDPNYMTGFNMAYTQANNGGVLTNDVGKNLMVTSVDGAATGTLTGATTLGGSVTVNALGGFTFTPSATESGADTFTYTATDGTTSYTQTATVTVGKPAVPVAVAEPFATTAVAATAKTGNAVTVPVITNNVGGTDTGSGKLTPVVATQPKNGTAVANAANGTITYTANPGFSGSDPFTYYDTDTYGGQKSNTVTEPVTVSPVGVTDTYTTPFNTVLAPTTVATGVLGNDLGSTLTGATVASNVSHGTLTLATNGTFTYTPASTYSGPDSFTYTATDGTTSYGPVTVNITVGKPAAPVASIDTFATTAVLASASAGTPVTVPVITNGAGGTDTGTGTLTPVVSVQPVNGTATVSGSGSTATITYTPKPGFSGLDPFSYYDTDTYGQQSPAVQEKVTVTPVGADDPNYATAYATALTQATAGGVLTNDAGSALKVTGVNGTANTLTGTTTMGGTVTFAAGGLGGFTFTPTATEFGADTLTYTATDGTTSYTQKVTITVSQPGAPVTPSDSKPTTAGNPNGAPVTLAGYSGQTYVPNSTIVRTDPANGKVTPGTTAGTYVYTPNGGFSGTDTFTYTVTDPTNQSSTGTETILVKPVGADDPGYTTNPNTPLTDNAAAGVLANDIGTALKVTGVNGTTKLTGTTSLGGAVTVGTDGSFTFTPIQSEYGADTFTYTATDGTTTYTQTATVTVGRPAKPVTPSDKEPTTAGPTTSTGVPVTLAGYSGQTYVPNSTITTTSAANGTFVKNANNTFTYTPKGGFSGTDSFTYTVTDPTGQASTGTETITVVPLGTTDTYSTPFNTVLAPSTMATGVLGNDLGSNLKGATVAAGPSHGMLTLNSDGTFSYTPTSGYAGADSFTYDATDGTTTYGPITVNITVGTPAAPTATAEPFTTTAQQPSGASTGSPKTVPVLSNDTGTGTLTPVIAVQANHGQAVVNANGTITYTPDLGFSGSDPFSYYVMDAYKQQSATVTEPVTVTPFAYPDAISDNFPGVVNAKTSTLTANDLGTTPLTVTSVDATSAKGGKVVLNGDGSYTYTPPPTYPASGTDSFNYVATDAIGQTTTAVVAVTLNLPAKPVTPNDSKSTSAGTPSGSSVTLAGYSGETYSAGSKFTNSTPTHGMVTPGTTTGTYVYTPNNGYSGPDSFTYTVTDAAGQPSTGTETITVVPVGANDNYTTPFNTALSPTTVAGGVLGNDIGSTLSVTGVTTATNGTVTPNNNGDFTYTPNPGYAGPDSFTYMATDGTTMYGPITVNITVGNPAAPVAVVDNFPTSAQQPTGLTTGTPVTVAVVANDQGYGTLTPTIVAQPKNGTAVVNSNNTITYTPNLGFSGSDPFTYYVTDTYNGGQKSATTTENVAVTPFANPDSVNDNFPGPVNANASTLTANDKGTGLTVTSVDATSADGGTVVLNKDGTYTYTPPKTFPASGSDTFSYTAKDSSGQTTTALVTVSLTKPGFPVAPSDMVSTSAGTPNGTPVPLPAGSGQTYTAGTTTTNTTPAHGSLAVNANGSYTYTPANRYSGPDSFTYTVTDAAGQASTGTETITVAPVGTDDPGYTAGANTPSSVNATNGVLANDIGTSLRVTGVQGTTSLTGTTTKGGSVSVGADGSFTFTPIQSEYGADTFTYTATDGTTPYTRTATITVARPGTPNTPSDSEPTTAGPVGSTGKPVGLAGYSGQTYVPNSTITNTTPANGSVAPGSTTGSYVYTPYGGFSGTDSFTYTVTDPTGQTSTGTETITVAPVAVASSQTVTAGSTLNAATPAGVGTGPFTATLVTAPVDNTGTFAVNPTTGAYTYTPKPGFVGTDSFTYTVTGAGGTSAPATVTITTQPAKPTAPGDTETTTAGTPLGAPVTLAGSKNATATGAVTVTNTAAKFGGTIAKNPDGTYTYTPAKNFSGTDSFTYTVTDGYNQSATGTETIVVTPTAVADSIKVTNSTAYTRPGSDLTANDSGSGLTVTAVTAKSAQGGTVTLSGGSFTYTPPTGYTGTDSFGYTDTDSSGQPVSSTVSVTVLPPAPVANNDTEPATPAGTPLTVSKNAGVLVNDSGAAPLIVTTGSTTAPTNGTLTGSTVNSDGSFTYTPKAGFSGTDSFTYTATDTYGQVSKPATVSITVKPVANADSQAVTAGTTLKAATPAATGTGTFTVALVTPPADGTGTFAINPTTGAYTYTPKAGFTGTDSFTYTVTGAGGTSNAATVTITVGTPTAPKAVGDSITTVTNKGVDTTGSGTSLLTNDSGDGPLSIPAANYTQPATGTGTVQVNTDGTYVYTPATGFSGTTSFTYTPVDVTNQPANGPATVAITVAPVALPATETTPAGSPVTFTLPAGLGTGSLPSTATQPVGGGTLAQNPNGTYTYTPPTGFVGTDSFTYTVSGAGGTSAAATVSINVSIPKPPVAGNDSYPATTDAPLTVAAPGILLNDSGAGPLVPSYPAKSTKGGTITPAANGAFTYTPPAGFSGTDTFTYTDTDAVSQTSNAATVTITVSPTTQPDSFTLTGGKPYTSPTSVLANDDGTLITAVVVAGPAHSTGFTLNPDGTFTYTPAAGYSGADSFTYRATDPSKDLSAVTTVSLTVFKPSAPVGQPDKATVVAGSGATAEPSVLTNDAGVGLTLGAVTATTGGGKVVTSPDGSYTYQPAPGFSGADTFTYIPVDGYQQPGAPVTVTVTVTPAASPASINAKSGTTATGTLPAGIGSPTLTYAPSTQPQHGTLTVNPDGSYAYTPTPGYLGADTFGYTVTGPGGTSLPATVSVNVVSPVAPVGTAGSGVTAAGTPLGGTVAGNDTGFGPLSSTVATGPSHGTLSLAPDGSYTYSPAAGFSGTDTFTYVVTDPFGQASAPITVTILVTPTANADSASTVEGAPLSGPSVLGNDLGSGLTAVQSSGPAHGTLVLNPDGTFTYTPAPGFAGTDGFSYIAVDSAGNRSAITTVNLTVGQVIPVLTGGTRQTSTVGGTLSPITFTDPSGSTPTVSTSKPGSLPPGLKLAASGAFIGKPTKAGTYTFPVTVTDPAGGAITETVTLVIKALAGKPTPATTTPPALAATTQVGTPLKLPKLGGPIVKVTGQLPPGIRVDGQSLVGTSSRAGSYTAYVTVQIRGKRITRKVTIVVRPANPVQPTGPLAFTGAPVPVGQAVGLGLLLMLIGGLLVVATGRRRPRRS